MRVEASIYKTTRHFLIHASERTPDGFWAPALPAYRIAATASAEELGSAILNALSGLPARSPNLLPSSAATSAPVLAALGVRSWSALQKTARLCLVSCDSVNVTAMPTRNGGVLGDARGYVEMPEAQASVSASCTSAQLGLVVVATLEKCL